MANGLSGIVLPPKEFQPLPVEKLQFVDGRTMAPQVDPNAVLQGLQLGQSMVAPLVKLFDPVEQAKNEEARWLASEEGQNYIKNKRLVEMQKLESEALQSQAISDLLKGVSGGGGASRLDKDGNIDLSSIGNVQPRVGATEKIGELPSGEELINVTVPTTVSTKIPGTPFSIPMKSSKTELMKSDAYPKATEEQSKSYIFYNSMKSAGEELNKILSDTDFDPSDKRYIIDEVNPIRMLRDKNFQRHQDMKRAWIAAAMRKESGAAISPSEYQNMDEQYFPQPGDTPELVAAKEQLRADRMHTMRTSTGPLQRVLDKEEGIDSRAGKPSANRTGGISKPRTQEEYNALPSGTTYIHPATGKTKVKQ